MLSLTTANLEFAALGITFAAVSALAYFLLRSRAERVGVRAGLERALANPSLVGTRALVIRTPWWRRVFRPAIGNLAGLVYRFGPVGLAQGTKRRLVLAGLSDRLDADAFLALSAALPIVGGACLYAYAQVAEVPPLLWLIVPASAAFPKIWLTGQVEARQRRIRVALADTLDLMTIAVEAGLGFDAALQRVVNAIGGPLSDELYRLLQEVRIGIRRADALTGLAERTQVSELDQFITAMNQADVFGISVGQVLRIQAAQLRQKRSQMAEERAAKTPVKLLFPLVLCIFPALFTVLVGPAAIVIMDNLFATLK
jgi:tight adherence protein C